MGDTRVRCSSRSTDEMPPPEFRPPDRSSPGLRRPPVPTPPLAPPPPPSESPPRLLDQLRSTIRVRNYSEHTADAHVGWIRRYVFFHKLRHPADMGSEELRLFLTHLARDRHVAASTQNQALCAILFLYRHVLQKDIGPVDAVRAKRPQRLPVVLTPREVRAVFSHLEGEALLVCQLLYGSG